MLIYNIILVVSQIYVNCLSYFVVDVSLLKLLYKLLSVELIVYEFIISLL